MGAGHVPLCGLNETHAWASPPTQGAFMIPGPRAVLVPMLTGGERCVRSGTPPMRIGGRGGREGGLPGRRFLRRAGTPSGPAADHRRRIAASTAAVASRRPMQALWPAMLDREEVYGVHTPVGIPTSARPEPGSLARCVSAHSKVYVQIPDEWDLEQPLSRF